MTVAASEPRKLPRCPICGQANLEGQIRAEHWDEASPHEKVAVVAERVPVEVCPACGEVFSGPPAWRIRDEARCRALGLLTAAEVRAVRERLGLTMADFAQVTGIPESTLAQWEAGRLIPDRAIDRYVRLIAAHPEHLPFLAQLTRANNRGRFVTTTME
jgi:HTH-type transcriptional regulator / antitoxin MqsA